MKTKRTRTVNVEVGYRVNSNLAFRCKACHQGSGSIAGIVLLDETNGRVDNQQGYDTNKVLPIWRFPLPKKKQRGTVGRKLKSRGQKRKCGKKRLIAMVSVHTPPLASAMAMMAAASITHDKGFHMNPKNFRTLLS